VLLAFTGYEVGLPIWQEERSVIKARVLLLSHELHTILILNWWLLGTSKRLEVVWQAKNNKISKNNEWQWSNDKIIPLSRYTFTRQLFCRPKMGNYKDTENEHYVCGRVWSIYGQVIESVSLKFFWGIHYISEAVLQSVIS
jgi:hypothetical protein